MTYKKLHDIRARVTARWRHKNCKFQRGDLARVCDTVLPRDHVTTNEHGARKIRVGTSYVSHKKQRRAAQIGEVVAVSCLPDGRIRNNEFRTGQATRMFTRYYIRFMDGTIMGFDSHHLKQA